MFSKLKINDKVRHIYPDYFSAQKNDYSQPSNWHKPEENTNDIMIGGEYTIIDIRKYHFFGRECKLTNINKWIDENMLQHSDMVKLCPYKTGDTVIYKPQCSKKEINFLLIANPNLKINQQYQIVKIVNNYYVILNVPYPEEWKKRRIELSKNLPEATIELMKKYPNMSVSVKDLPDESLPLRWIDLEKV